jgi:hypothetical protein
VITLLFEAFFVVFTIPGVSPFLTLVF